MSMNRVCLMGRIGRDLELKKTNSGVSVVSFPLAVDRNGKEGGTDWIDIVAWRGTAEVLCNYADKGRMIGVEGRLQKYTTENAAGGFAEVSEDDGELPF